MAKQDTAASTTLSTRFDEQELALLRLAAEKRQWSLSQLIRIGAYEKAANIVNADSPAAYPVRRLLAEVVKQLFQAKVMEEDRYDQYAEPCEFDADRYGIDGQVSVFASTLNQSVLASLLSAIRSLGTELAPMLGEEFMRAFANCDTVGNLIDPTATGSLPSGESTEATPEPAATGAQKKSKGAKKASKRKTSRKEK